MLFANEGNTAVESGVVIHFGDGQGEFANRPALHLPGMCSSGLELADLDQNGHLDIVLANKYLQVLQLPRSSEPISARHAERMCFGLEPVCAGSLQGVR